ncbi:MAG: polyisoprenoid-binding protein YceI [Arenicella sp.]|jgi:polyisoprenoid-binding protein YceI
MKKIILLTLLSCGLLSACVSLITPKVESDVVKLKAGEYSLDTSHATLLFKIQHLGLSTYVGRFNKFDASLEFDPDNIAAATLSAIIEIDSLDINDPDLKDDLMGRAWFRQAEFPQAKFASSSVRPISDTEFEFSGQLNWRGVQKLITVTATFNGGASNMLSGKYTLGFSAKGAFSRSDFGMDKFVPLVGDQVTIEAYAEFLKN